MNFIRTQAQRLVDTAAQAGYPAPMSLLDCTPREVRWALKAFAAKKRRELELTDTLAWLIGQYVAIGVNAPKKYPNRPNIVGHSSQATNDAQIKEAFQRMAGRSERI